MHSTFVTPFEQWMRDNIYGKMAPSSEIKELLARAFEGGQQSVPDKVYKWIPADNYEALVKQFNSAKMLCNSLEGQLAYYREQDYSLSKKRLDALEAALESERDMNAKLTEELLLYSKT